MGKPNYICTVGLIPFLVRFLYTRSVVSCIVFCNGVLYHLIAPNSKLVKWYDIVSNGVLIVYVNIHVLDMYVFLWSVATIMCYFCNKCYTRDRVIHVVGVQWGGLKALQMAKL
jgi:hypothetical protein